MAVNATDQPSAVKRGFFSSLRDVPIELCLAVWRTIGTLVFYQETKDLKQAEAADKWEDVRAKRISNLKAALELMPKGPQRTRLLEDVLKQNDRLR